MHITLLAVGSRGDVQPMITLGLALEARGHGVRVASHSNFQALIEGHGLEYFALSGDSSRFYGGATGNAFRDRLTVDLTRYKRFVDQYLAAYARRLMAECVEACHGTDLIVSWPWTRTGSTLSEHYGVPHVLMSLSPPTYMPSSTFANPYFGGFKAGLQPEENLATWDDPTASFEIGAEIHGQWRQSLGLPTISIEDEVQAYRDAPQLLAWSSAVLPRSPEWHDRVYLPGFFSLIAEGDYSPPAELVDFLEDGPPPVLFGFGSNVGRQGGLDPKALTEVVMGAARRAEVRAIFISGFGGLQAGQPDPKVFVTNGVLYSWLLPRCAGMVHHGGAGSMSDGLRAACPSLAIPFGFDQPLWASRIHELGVAPPPIPVVDLNLDRLTTSVRQLVEDPELKTRALAVSQDLRQEDGPGRAAELLETWH